MYSQRALRNRDILKDILAFNKTAEIRLPTNLLTKEKDNIMEGTTQTQVTPSFAIFSNQVFLMQKNHKFSIFVSIHFDNLPSA